MRIRLFVYIILLAQLTFPLQKSFAMNPQEHETSLDHNQIMSLCNIFYSSSLVNPLQKYTDTLHAIEQQGYMTAAHFRAMESCHTMLSEAPCNPTYDINFTHEESFKDQLFTAYPCLSSTAPSSLHIEQNTSHHQDVETYTTTIEITHLPKKAHQQIIAALIKNIAHILNPRTFLAKLHSIRCSESDIQLEQLFNPHWSAVITLMIDDDSDTMHASISVNPYTPCNPRENEATHPDNQTYTEENIQRKDADDLNENNSTVLQTLSLSTPQQSFHNEEDLDPSEEPSTDTQPTNFEHDLGNNRNAVHNGELSQNPSDLMINDMHQTNVSYDPITSATYHPSTNHSSSTIEASHTPNWPVAPASHHTSPEQNESFEENSPSQYNHQTNSNNQPSDETGDQILNPWGLMKKKLGAFSFFE